MRLINKALDSKLALPLLALVAVIVRMPKLFSGLNEEYAFRQTQTAFVARNFLEGGIDLFTTTLPVFGKDSQVPFEFPLFQALVALVSPSVTFVEPIGRGLSLCFFIASGLIVVSLIRRLLNNVSASLFFAWYLFSPFSLEWGSAFLIENLAVFLGVSSAYIFYRSINQNKYTLVPIASLLMAGSFLVKSTTAPVYCLLALALVAPNLSNSWRLESKDILKVLVTLAAFSIPGLAAAYVWTRFSDHIKSQSFFTEKLTSSALTSWNFGTLEQRLQPETYLPILNRVFQEILGPSGVVLLLAGLFISLKQKRIEIPLLVITAACGPFIFLNLYYVHTYYLSAIYPILIFAITFAITMVSQHARKANKFAVTSGALIVAQIISYPLMPLARNDVRLLTASVEAPEVSQSLEKNSNKTDTIVLIKCDWDPTYLYYAKREGLMLPEWIFSNGKSEMAKAIAKFADNATKVVFCQNVENPQEYLPENFRLRKIASEGFSIFDVTRDR